MGLSVFEKIFSILIAQPENAVFCFYVFFLISLKLIWYQFIRNSATACDDVCMPATKTRQSGAQQRA